MTSLWSITQSQVRARVSGHACCPGSHCRVCVGEYRVWNLDFMTSGVDNLEVQVMNGGLRAQDILVGPIKTGVWKYTGRVFVSYRNGKLFEMDPNTGHYRLLLLDFNKEGEPYTVLKFGSLGSVGVCATGCGCMVSW